jgi:hypothetical protein
MHRGIGFAPSLEWPRGLIGRADRVRFPFARLQIGFCIESFLREVRSPAFGSKAHPPASPATQWRATVSGGYGENMEDTNVKKLSVDFSQDHDLEAINTKVLAFLKDDAAESGTVTCVIREAGEAGNTVPLVYHLGLGQAEAEIVEASAGQIAASLAEYAKGKDGKLYSDATIEILHP